jgi:isopentenyl-diphosphate Delta-isomerase
MTEYVILVDENDQAIGICEKMEAHEKGLLHRAFSVFVFNDKGEMLLQRRALSKYHSPGLWTNTCCSHPRENESVEEAAHRRLKEEMGFDCQLEEVFSFTYNAAFSNGLIEHEFDHVLIGKYDSSPLLNTEEAAEYKWISIKEVLREAEENPNNFTEWFKIILPKLVEHLKD